MGGSYFVLRLNNISDEIAILITLVLLVLPPISIYLLLIRPRSLPTLLAYLSFIFSLGISYLIIPSLQNGFFNQILVWLLPILEITIVIVVLHSIIKIIIRYRANNQSEGKNFLELTIMSLEPKLGDGFVLGAILTELNVFYYLIVGCFKRISIIENEKVYSYHKTSQIKMIVIVFSILITLEAIFLHILIQLWSDVAAWIFTILNNYALLYIIGLYNSVRFLPHIVSGGQLIIRLGYQSCIQLDVKNIDCIKMAKDKGGIGEKIPKDTYYALLNIDSPQYEIYLKEPILMESSYGRKKYVKTVIFRADNPGKMIEEIKYKMTSLSND